MVSLKDFYDCITDNWGKSTETIANILESKYGYTKDYWYDKIIATKKAIKKIKLNQLFNSSML
jgi:hypothetical protein